VFCGGEVSERTGYRRVTGWEKRRRAGGTNAIVMREPQPIWACFTCIELKRTGHEGQESLL